MEVLIWLILFGKLAPEPLAAHVATDLVVDAVLFVPMNIMKVHLGVKSVLLHQVHILKL